MKYVLTFVAAAFLVVCPLATARAEDDAKVDL